MADASPPGLPPPAPYSRRLRIGLLMNEPRVNAWQARMLQRIVDEGHAEIVVLVCDAGLASKFHRRPWWGREVLRALRQAWRRRIAAFRNRIDGTTNLPDPFQMQELPPVLQHVPQLLIRPLREGPRDAVQDADLEGIRAHRPDLLVRLGFQVLHGGILTLAECGVWSFHHGDNRVKRGLPPSFWEILERSPVVGTTLQILSERLDAGLVLARTTSATHLDSLARTNILNYWKSLSLLPRQLARLHRLGSMRFLAEVQRENAAPDFYSNALYRKPRPMLALHLWMRTMLRGFRERIVERFAPGGWNLLVSTRPEKALSLRHYRRLIPPKGCIWADPFVIQRDGKTCIFFEEQLGRTNGHIAVAELSEGGRYRISPVIKTRWHLSYPFLLEHDGQLYMIPESRGAHCICLYRCVEFPHKWERLPDLMSDVHAVDSTVFFREGRWWMFTTLIENPGSPSTDELFIFSATEFPTNQWTPHPLNPVISDVRRGRMAGAFFVGKDGCLYRPAQDGSHRYGGSMSFNRVDRLDMECYAETTVSLVEPDWSPLVCAVHTYNHHGDIHVFDALFRRRGN